MYDYFLLSPELPLKSNSDFWDTVYKLLCWRARAYTWACTNDKLLTSHYYGCVGLLHRLVNRNVKLDANISRCCIQRSACSRRGAKVINKTRAISLKCIAHHPKLIIAISRKRAILLTETFKSQAKGPSPLLRSIRSYINFLNFKTINIKIDIARFALIRFYLSHFDDSV